MKLLFADVETTGTDPKLHGIVQLAVIVEIDGEIRERMQWPMAPLPTDQIEDEALRVNGLTRADLLDRPSPAAVYAEFVGLLGQYVDKFDRGDKFMFVGFNATFDDNFLRAWFRKAGGDKYYGSWFHWPPIDVAVLAAAAMLDRRHTLPSFKLAAVGAVMGIPVDESKTHDAAYDIELTREIYRRLVDLRTPAIEGLFVEHRENEVWLIFRAKSGRQCGVNLLTCDNYGAPVNETIQTWAREFADRHPLQKDPVRP